MIHTRAIALWAALAQGVLLAWLIRVDGETGLFRRFFFDLDIPRLYWTALGIVAVLHVLAVRLKSDLIAIFGCYVSFCVVPKIVSLQFGLRPAMYYYGIPYPLPDSAIETVLRQYGLFGLCFAAGVFLANSLFRNRSESAITRRFRPAGEVLRQLSPRVKVLLLIWGAFALFPFVSGAFFARFGSTALLRPPGSAPLYDYLLTIVSGSLFSGSLYFALVALCAWKGGPLRRISMGLLAALLLSQILSGYKGAVFYVLQVFIIFGAMMYLGARLRLKQAVLAIAALAAGIGGYVYAALLRESIYSTGRVSFASAYEVLFQLLNRQGENFDGPVVALTSPLFEGRLTMLRSLKAFIDGSITPGFSIFGELNGSHTFHFIQQGATGIGDYIYQSTPLGFIPEVILTFGSFWWAGAILCGFVLTRLTTARVSRRYPEVWYVCSVNAVFSMGFIGGGLDELAYAFLNLFIAIKFFEYFAARRRQEGGLSHVPPSLALPGGGSLPAPVRR